MSGINIMQNPSCLLYKPGQSGYEDMILPEITQPTDVIVKIAFVGVCGSDVHIWMHGGIKNHVTEGSPVVMGHEASGIVHSVGEAVANVQPGDLIAIEPIAACHTCPQCKVGKYNHCPSMNFAGDPQMRHGTLTKFFKLTEEYCWKIPQQTLTAKEAALIEPLAVAVHAVRGACINPGRSVVIFGAGPIGFLCAAVAREFGASKIISVDLNEQKSAMVKRFIAVPGVVVETFTPNRHANAKENAKSILDRFSKSNECPGNADGFDAVIEATGADSCIDMGISVLGVGGSFTEVAIREGNISFPMLEVVKKEIKLHGSFLYTAEDFHVARSLAVRGKVNLGSLITGIYSFENAVEAWRAVKEGNGMKVLIQGVESSI